MLDRPNHPSDRLDDCLNGDNDGGEDDLAAFAGRVVRQGSLREDGLLSPTAAQVERIRERVFGNSTAASREEEAPMTTHSYIANGHEPATTMVPIEPARPTPASPLSILMTAALIVLIAVASFGAYRGSLDFLPGGADPNPTESPGIAASMVATPSATAACDGSQWVSVFDWDVPELLVDEPHVRLAEGTLTWHCGGTSEVLARNVSNADALYWPGVIAIQMEGGNVRLHNLSTDRSIDLHDTVPVNDDGSIDYQSAIINSGAVEPWLVAPVDDDFTDWRVIDLRSMESFQVSEDGVLDDGEYRPFIGTLSGTDIGVVVWRDRSSTLDATPIDTGVSLPSDEDALVLPGSIEDRRWVDIVDYRAQGPLQYGTSQVFSVSSDGDLIAYTTLSSKFEPIIRVEQAASGTDIVDVPIDDIDLDTRFAVAGTEPHLLYANGDTVRVYKLGQGVFREIEEMPGPDISGFLPTADVDTVLFTHGGDKAVTPVHVTDPDAQTEFYNYVPSATTQVFGSMERPKYMVRVVSETITGTPARIQLVDPTSHEVVLESQTVDAHPIQIISFQTFLRDDGRLAVVPIGYNRAVVFDAANGETWQIEAPVDDDRLWRFYPSMDGRFVTAWPDPPIGTSDYVDGHIAPLVPGAEWVPIEGETKVGAPMVEDGTPAG